MTKLVDHGANRVRHGPPADRTDLLFGDPEIAPGETGGDRFRRLERLDDLAIDPAIDERDREERGEGEHREFEEERPLGTGNFDGGEHRREDHHDDHAGDL